MYYSSRRKDHRFTIIGLTIAAAILVISITMNGNVCSKPLIRFKEDPLHQDLFVMRWAIQNYTLDKSAAPQNLTDLVNAKYMRWVPTDPITGKKDWDVQTSDTVLSTDQVATGISNVHSRSAKTSRYEHTAYNTW